MDVKELIQHLRCFDEDHHVVIAIQDGDYPDIERNIREVKFDGWNCVVRTESD